jgi:hypothetical protein
MENIYEIKEECQNSSKIKKPLENKDSIDKSRDISSEDKNLETFKQDYFEFENVLKQVLSRNLEKQFKLLYHRLNDSEKNYFEIKNLNNLTWVFNVNSVYSYRGDLSTSSLQKFFYLIFKDIDEESKILIESDMNDINEINMNCLKIEYCCNEKGKSLLKNMKNFDLDPKSEFLKFKSSFVELFNSTFLMTLNGENLILDKFNLNEWISKVEFKNGFLNFFLKGKAKELADSQKKKNEKKTKWSKHEESGYIVSNLI